MKKKSQISPIQPSQNNAEVLDSAREVLDIEAAAIAALKDRIGDAFLQAIQLLLNCQGRVVVTGIGKSGHIGHKVAATLSSTGTPAIFLHPAEGVHGDLGIVTEGDVVIAFSYGGNTNELTAILPAIKRLGVPIIAICGRCDSELGRRAEVVLDVSVEKEACPLNMAPTTSTTAMLAMGDALAVTLMHIRRFSLEDYKKLHPAGRLGRQMLLAVEDIMRKGDSVASVDPDMRIQDVLFSITAAHAGLANVVDEHNRLLGVICDGDIRRYLMTHPDGLQQPVKAAMICEPKTIAPSQLATEAMRIMEHYQIAEMPVLDAEKQLIGVLNLKDLLRAGII